MKTFFKVQNASQQDTNEKNQMELVRPGNFRTKRRADISYIHFSWIGENV